MNKYLFPKQVFNRYRHRIRYVQRKGAKAEFFLYSNFMNTQIQFLSGPNYSIYITSSSIAFTTCVGLNVCCTSQQRLKHCRVSTRQLFNKRFHYLSMSTTRISQSQSILVSRVFDSGMVMSHCQEVIQKLLFLCILYYNFIQL